MTDLYPYIYQPYDPVTDPYRDLTDDERNAIAIVQVLSLLAVPVVVAIVCALASLL